MQNNNMQNTEGVIQLAIRAFEGQCNRLTKWLSAVSDEVLLEEVAPGKNTGLYLLGHLVAINDGMLPLFDLGKREYPELDDVFVMVPDKSVSHHYTPRQVKDLWLRHTDLLISKLSELSSAEWLHRHSSVSEEDFIQQPYRNKLNVLLNRTNHLAYHIGQLALLKRG
jgi:hypothetical protein